MNVPPVYPIAAVYKNTAPDPTSPYVMPGNYTVILTVNGVKYTQPLTIKMDPRVRISKAELQKQHDLSVICYEGRKQCMDALSKIREMRAQLHDKIATDAAAKGKDDELVIMETGLPGSEGTSFNKLNNAFASLLNTMQDADAAPTSQVIAAVKEAQENLKLLMSRYGNFKF